MHNMPLETSEPISIENRDLFKHAEAVLNGLKHTGEAVLNGLKHTGNDYVKLFQDPMGEYIIPMSTLIFDATVIYVAHAKIPISTSNDYVNLYQFILKNKPIYQDAVARMRERGLGIKSTYHTFKEGTAYQQIEMLSHGISSIFAPGFIFKGTLSAIKMSHNMRDFGHLYAPVQFRNVYPNEAIDLSQKFQLKTALDIRSTWGKKEYLGVIVGREKKLLIAEKNQADFELHHHQLAGLQDVYWAGEFTTFNGFLDFKRGIVSKSGHYLPTGDHLPEFVEGVFVKFGVQEATMSYKSIRPEEFTSAKQTPTIIHDDISFMPTGKQIVITSPFFPEFTDNFILGTDMKNTFTAYDLNYLAINSFITHHYDSIWGTSLSRSQAPVPSIEQSIQGAWYSLNSDRGQLKQLSEQFHYVRYLTKEHGYFLNTEGKATLLKAQYDLNVRLSAYTPSAFEAKEYMELKTQLADLAQLSQHLYPDNANSHSNIFKRLLQQSKTPDDLKNGFNAVQEGEEFNPKETPIVDAFTAHDSKKLSQETPSFETALAWENGGKASMELSRLAYAEGNSGLGKALMIGGTTAQGIAAGIHFQLATGASAIGYAAGVLGAMTTVAMTLFAKSEGNAALGETLQYISEQIVLLRQEIYKLAQFTAQFRTELYERLRVYFDALNSQLNYMEEVYRNGYFKIAHKLDRLKQISEAIFAFLQDTILYQVRDYYEGITDINTLSNEAGVKLLSQMHLLLDQSQTVYKSGEGLCQLQAQQSTVATRIDVQAMLDDPIERGQLFGYLACYSNLHGWTQLLNLTAPSNSIINHMHWNEVIKLYLYLRRAPSLRGSDQDFKKLNHFQQQGEQFIQFVHGLQNNIVPLLKHLHTKIITHLDEALFAFEYTEVAKKLIRQDYPMPNEALNIVNHFGGHKSYRIPNSYIALVEAGFGTFKYKRSPCPVGHTYSFELVPYVRKKLRHNLQKYMWDFTHPIHLSSSMQFVANSKLKHYLFQTSGSYLNSALQNCNIQPIFPFNKAYSAEINKEHLTARRNLTQIRIDFLDKNLPILRERITTDLLSIKAILIAAGTPAWLVAQLPTFEFAEELSAWIEPYRADLRHEESYRPLPISAGLETLRHFKKSMDIFLKDALDFVEAAQNPAHSFSFGRFGILHEGSKEFVFQSAEIATVSLRLSELNQLKQDLLFTGPSLDPKTYQSATQEQSPPTESSVLSLFNKIMEKMLYQEQREEVLIGQNKLIIEQNKLIIEQQNKLSERLDAFESKATVFVNAADASISTVFATWHCTNKLSDERTCMDLNDKNHIFHIRKLSLHAWENINLQVDKCNQTEPHVKYCTGEEIEYVEYIPPKLNASISMILGIAALNGALSAAIPEAIGDILYLNNHISEKTAEKIKFAINLLMVAFLIENLNQAGLWLVATIIMQVVYSNLKKLGYSESFSRITASTTAFVVNNSHQISAITITQSAVTHFSGKLGFWAEKQAVKLLSSTASKLGCDKQLERKGPLLSQL